MKVTVSGASGLIGSRLLTALRARGDEVAVLGRQAASEDAFLWQPTEEPAPAVALAGRDAVVHLAGENIAQRWSAAARRKIRDSRVRGTENLLAGLQLAEPRPKVLVCASAVGYYGDRGPEPLDDDAAPGDDWLAQVCVDWERAAAAAGSLGMRTCSLRTGVVLAPSGGALARMLPAFRLGLGGPIAGGRQYVSWIHIDDLVGLYLAALDDERYSGAVNATAPIPATNTELGRALGRVLHRPAIMPVPSLALRLLYGSMAEVVIGGQNAPPGKALSLGYSFRHSELEPALRETVTAR